MPGTSEPLVPVGLPYGERQEQVGQMRQAGLPLSPRQSSMPSPSGAQQTAGPPAAPLDGGGLPASSDPFDELQPSQPWDYQPADPDAHLRQLSQVSPNAFVRALLSKMLGEAP